MRRSQNFQSAQLLGALFLALLAAGAVKIFLGPFIPFVLVGGSAIFCFLIWRRRATNTDFAIRFGFSIFLFLLALILFRAWAGIA